MEKLIKNIRSYIPLSTTDENVIAKLFHKKNFLKGEHLLEAGQICRRLMFIEKGLVRYYLFANGEEKTHYFNKEDQWVCDYQSFLPKVPTTVNIQALEDLTIWTISYVDLQIFYQDIQHGERFGRLGIEQVFVHLIGQIDSIYSNTPAVRYEKFVRDYFDIAQRIPQYHIASFVGVKPQSLSRIRKRIRG